MILNEVFYSIQGEGLNVGKPAVFVRFGNCNLKCTWCDTKYTWQPGVADNKSVELADLFKKIRGFECKHLVITGGEPMLQQNVILKIREEFTDYYIEVETNGSLEVRCEEAVDLLTVSYKTSSSGNAPYELKTIGPKCVYKFVVDSIEDLDEIEEVIARYNLPIDRIFLMPQGATREEVISRHEMVIDACKKRGYRFSPRLHILIWDKARKV